MRAHSDIAIVGMSCIFPGAGDAGSFWRNIENKVDAIQVVPEGRMERIFFDERAKGVDRFYCKRGGWIDEYASFNPGEFGLLPVSVEGTEPEHLLTLKLAHRALMDAGVWERRISLDKTGIIIGKGNYAGPGATRAIEIIRTGQQLVQVLEEMIPSLTGAELDRVKKEFQTRKGRFAADTAMGLIPNLVASLVSNRLDLGGPAYTVDAACASSLVAIDSAIKELADGNCDMVIAGGVHACQNAPFWSIFTQLGALSRNQQIRPFDRRADGLLIGEGCGFVVLRRLEDALRDEHRIYAVIKSVGIASDGAGSSVMSPSVKGQTRAIRRAWEKAGLDSFDLGYIEAHGTATPLGDRIELETLTEVFGPALPGSLRAGIGSVKSNIGHAMPAAGIAGVIKTAFALYYGKLPPTLHCEEPLEAMKESRFLPVRELIDWEDSGLPLRAGVNAFGFGGINAHLVMEGVTKPRRGRKGGALGLDRPVVLARATAAALVRALENKETDIGRGDFRIVVFEPTEERIIRAIKIVERGKPWRNRQDIWFTNKPLVSDGGKVAFLFPGLDGLTGGEVGSVADYFGLEMGAVDESGTVLASALRLTDRSHVLDTALKRLGVQPDLNAGHSVGEWLAGRSAGWVSEETVTKLLGQLDSHSFEIPEVGFLVVGCGYEQVEPLLEGIANVYLSNDNCPQQVILCGTNAALAELTGLLQARQIFHQLLPIRSGFHSPFLKDRMDILMENMRGIRFQPARIPLWSATTVQVYPNAEEEILSLSIEHLLQPVRFRELTMRLYEEGVRVFIQVGAGGLTGFIDDTLKGREYSSVAAGVAVRPGLAQLQRVLAALFVEGAVVDESFLGVVRTGTVQLQLGSPLVRGMETLRELSVPVKKGAAATVSGTPRAVMTSVERTFLETVTMLSDSQDEVLAMFRQSGGGEIIHSLNISLGTHPYLIDHALVRQREGWSQVRDMDPVIPMTMMLQLFGEIAEEHSGGRPLRKMKNIKVLQWMNVATPFRETVRGQWQGKDQLFLDLDRYASAEMVFGGGGNVDGVFEIGESLGVRLTPELIYEQHMFHGPAYQGIREVMEMGKKGIRGIIEGGEGKGSLLDNAGQLFGLWLQFILEKDRIAFPVKINEIEFYGDWREQAGRFECICCLTVLNDDFATGEFLIRKEGRVWAVIRGWQNRRLEIDQQFWRVAMSPLHNFLSEEIAPGVFFFHNAYSRVVSWDLVFKRYFNGQERDGFSAMTPGKKKEWTISRIAAKDAVRATVLRYKKEAYYPIEIEIQSDERGRPVPSGPGMASVRLSLAHKGTDAVAVAAYGSPVGVDIESIETRDEEFLAAVFHPDELSMGAGEDLSVWATRCWVAKEAYGKSIGLGLQGDPKVYRISEVRGDVLRIKDTVIKTMKYKNYIIGWTL
ncbi:MAG: acyltransferase domain-containing protein [Bacteroidetes bacterium]|nr:acyltransferase domain-containing protein [Bacteroidota bacterium]